MPTKHGTPYQKTEVCYLLVIRIRSMMMTLRLRRANKFFICCEKKKMNRLPSFRPTTGYNIIHRFQHDNTHTINYYMIKV